jgi:hypothetical protein
MIYASNETSAAALAASYRRELEVLGRIPALAEWFHIPMQEIRIGFREHDEACSISTEALNLELHGA